MIRQFLTVLKLPKEVQILFEKRLIDSVDIAKELNALDNKTIQMQLAVKILNAPSKDVRDIKRLVKGYRRTIDQAINAVEKSKPENMHLFILDLNDHHVRLINEKANREGVTPADLVKRIITEWVQKENQ